MAGPRELQNLREEKYRDLPDPVDGVEIVTTALEDGGAMISIVGELDLAGVDDLRAALQRAGEAHTKVVLTLSECEFIDCAALGSILHERARLASERRQLLLCSPRGQVRRVLAIAGLTEDGLVVEDPEEASS
jgi:anti-anti-sigma factor